MSKRPISEHDNNDYFDLRQSLVLTQLRAKWAPSTVGETCDASTAESESEAAGRDDDDHDDDGSHRSIDTERNDNAEIDEEADNGEEADSREPATAAAVSTPSLRCDGATDEKQ